MNPARPWIPDRRDIIWIDFSPQVGKEMRDRHPMLVISPRAYNERTSLVIGLPMSSAAFNATNPFAVDNSKSASESSYIICNSPRVLTGASAAPAPIRGARCARASFATPAQNSTTLFN